MDHERAIEYIKGKSGTQFDPEVVKAFLYAMEDGSEQETSRAPMNMNLPIPSSDEDSAFH